MRLSKAQNILLLEAAYLAPQKPLMLITTKEMLDVSG